MVKDQERLAVCNSRPCPSGRTNRRHHPERVRLVLSVSYGPLAAGQPWHALFVYVPPAAARCDPIRNQPRSATHVEDPRGKGGAAQGNPRPYPEPRAARRELEELRPLDLHARKTHRHGPVERIRHSPLAKFASRSRSRRSYFAAPAVGADEDLAAGEVWACSPFAGGPSS
jgi:hypothetical protein